MAEEINATFQWERGWVDYTDENCPVFRIRISEIKYAVNFSHIPREHHEFYADTLSRQMREIYERATFYATRDLQYQLRRLLGL